jgi:hypothetical protein
MNSGIDHYVLSCGKAVESCIYLRAFLCILPRAKAGLAANLGYSMARGRGYITILQVVPGCRSLKLHLHNFTLTALTKIAAKVCLKLRPGRDEHRCAYLSKHSRPRGNGDLELAPMKLVTQLERSPCIRISQRPRAKQPAYLLSISILELYKSLRVLRLPHQVTFHPPLLVHRSPLAI